MKGGENMKKIISIIVLSLFLSSALMAEAAVQSVQNDTTFGTSTVTKQVDFVSKVVIATSTSENEINEDSTSAIEIFSGSIINNSADGFGLILTAANGNLSNSMADVGASNIDYTISSTLSENNIADHDNENNPSYVNDLLSESGTDDTAGLLVLGTRTENDGDAAVGGQYFIRPTNTDFTVSYTLTDASLLGMAGSYAETFTLTYTDH